LGLGLRLRLRAEAGQTAASAGVALAWRERCRRRMRHRGTLLRRLRGRVVLYARVFVPPSTPSSSSFPPLHPTSKRIAHRASGIHHDAQGDWLHKEPADRARYPQVLGSRGCSQERPMAQEVEEGREAGRCPCGRQARPQVVPDRACASPHPLA